MRKLILIVEDDESFRSTVFELLELEDFNVVSAEDGLIGLQLAKEMQPDLILCDINMPGLDGYGILKKLREDWITAQIPVIFLTARTDQESRLQALQIGVNDYLTKPVRFNKLLNSIINQLKMPA
mgnify:CR=1 FL=1